MDNKSFFLQNNSPLAKKMLLLILLSSTIITFTIIIIQLFFEYKTEVFNIEKRISQVQNSYIKPLALSVWTFDKSQYEAQLNGILNIQDIVYVKIVSQDGSELISKGLFQKSNKITRQFSLKTTIHAKHVKLGKLLIHATLQRVYEDLYKRFLIILLTQGIKTLIISFVILYLFHILITRHLYEISEYVKNIDIDSKQELKLNKQNSNDEIDAISFTLNDMQHKIQHKQSELEKLNQELEAKVKARTKELEKLMFIQNKMASLGKMIENIAHQWRQPLSSINTSVLLIDQKINQKNISYDSIEKDLDSIELTTLYLSKTIDDIRDFYSTQKIKSDFLLFETIESSLNIISGLLQKHQIAIEKNYDKTIRLFNYPNELQQVVLSILQNAKDVLVQRDIKNPKITINLFKQESRVYIQIIDNGGGVDEEIVEKIFDLYFTTKAEDKGSGIGLYIAHLIVKESLNALLEVKNSSNGACFEISFS